MLKAFIFLATCGLSSTFVVSMFFLISSGRKLFRARKDLHEASRIVKNSTEITFLSKNLRERKKEHATDRKFLLWSLGLLITIVYVKIFFFGRVEHGTLFYVHMVFVILLLLSLISLFTFFSGKKKIHHDKMAYMATIFAVIVAMLGMAIFFKGFKG